MRAFRSVIVKAGKTVGERVVSTVRFGMGVLSKTKAEVMAVQRQLPPHLQSKTAAAIITEGVKALIGHRAGALKDVKYTVRHLNNIIKIKSRLSSYNIDEEVKKKIVDSLTRKLGDDRVSAAKYLRTLRSVLRENLSVGLASKIYNEIKADLHSRYVVFKNFTFDVKEGKVITKDGKTFMIKNFKELIEKPSYKELSSILKEHGISITKGEYKTIVEQYLFRNLLEKHGNDLVKASKHLTSAITERALVDKEFWEALIEDGRRYINRTVNLARGGRILADIMINMPKRLTKELWNVLRQLFGVIPIVGRIMHVHGSAVNAIASTAEDIAKSASHALVKSSDVPEEMRLHPAKPEHSAT